MDKEEKQAVEQTLNAGEGASVESPTETKAPAAEVEEKESRTEEAPAAEASAEAKGEAEVKTEPAEKRPSRAEKRIHKLIDKLKAASAAQETGGIQPPQPTAASGLEAGGLPWQPGQEVTPEELEQELAARAAQLSELTTRKVISEYERKQQIEKFAGELEQLQREAPELAKGEGYDKDFDEKLSDLIVAVNSDEKGGFVYKKSPREIYEALKAVYGKARTKGQAESTAKMAKTIAEGAVTPGAGKTYSRRDTEAEALFAEAAESGSVEKWAEYLKRTVLSPKKK